MVRSSRSERQRFSTWLIVSGEVFSAFNTWTSIPVVMILILPVRTSELSELPHKHRRSGKHRIQREQLQNGNRLSMAGSLPANKPLSPKKLTQGFKQGGCVNVLEKQPQTRLIHSYQALIDR